MEGGAGDGGCGVGGWVVGGNSKWQTDVYRVWFLQALPTYCFVKSNNDLHIRHNLALFQNKILHNFTHSICFTLC